MCFSPQRRALFRHRNFQKWSERGVFCTFWLRNVLRATTACTFSTSQLPKVVRTWCVLYIFTWRCASRHNGVHFFDIATSKSGPRWCVLYILTWTRASRHNGVQFFITHLASWLRTRRFSEPTFRPSRATNHWKNTVFRDFPTFSRICIFFLLTLSLLLFFLLIFLFSLPLLSASSLLCFPSVHIVGSLTSKLPSISPIEFPLQNGRCRPSYKWFIWGHFVFTTRSLTRPFCNRAPKRQSCGFSSVHFVRVLRCKVIL